MAITDPHVAGPPAPPTPGTGLGALLEGWAPVLDGLGTNIFIADLDLVLRFANATAHRTLRTIEPSLRAAFGLSAQDIVGGSIHRFHRNPSHVEGVLHGRAGVSFPHHATFDFDQVVLRTNIDLVRDGNGTHVGYAVAWEDISDLDRSQRAVRELGEHLDSAATAVEELSASIGEIARSATQAADATGAGREDVQRTIEAVQALGDASTQIGEVVRTITKIAQQTNVLALNATIEAARAGEAGRGFAVVAGEVKELARDTANATDDISKRIAAVRSSVETVVNEIQGIGEVLGHVDEIQSTVAATVEQQRVATDQLARSVSDAADNSRSLVFDQ